MTSGDAARERRAGQGARRALAAGLAVGLCAACGVPVEPRVDAAAAPPALPAEAADAPEPDAAAGPEPDAAATPSRVRDAEPPAAREVAVPASGRLASGVDAGGLPGPPNACYGLKGENRLLPGTGVRYCVGAHPDCKIPGAGCPLYVTFNTTGAFFKRLQDPARWGKLITVESRQDFEGPQVGDPFAELPRVIARDFPGLDENRIYALGNSRGAAAITRSLCRKTYRLDQSRYGTVTDVYAAVVTVALCPVCDDGFVPRMGNIHFLALDGENDTTFAREHCVPELQRLARGYRCASPQGSWCNVPPDEGLPTRGDGSDKIRKFTVGACQHGGLVGYLLRDEGHTYLGTRNFTPPLDGYDVAWAFFADKRKLGGGANVGVQCNAP